MPPTFGEQLVAVDVPAFAPILEAARPRRGAPDARLSQPRLADELNSVPDDRYL